MMCSKWEGAGAMQVMKFYVTLVKHFPDKWVVRERKGDAAAPQMKKTMYPYSWFGPPERIAKMITVMTVCVGLWVSNANYVTIYLKTGK